MDQPVFAPETLEGWYALHQQFALDRSPLAEPDTRRAVVEPTVSALEGIARPEGGGWSAVVELVGSRADVMLVHFRPTLESLGEAQRAVALAPIADRLSLVDSFLSVTEAGMYHLSAQLAKDAAARGGTVGDDAYQAEMSRRLAAERDSAHVQRRLYPPLPADMPYVCFYPMDKRRDAGQNWYTLTLEERSRLMHSHGLTGRRYAGRVFQVITGAIGLDAWEWGVTLFARDPLSFKKLVTEMRFDEASAKYAEFGEFWVGKLVEPREWVERAVR